MAAREQVVSVDFRSLNQQAPTTSGPVGRLDRLNNGVVHKFAKGGQGPQMRIDKRPGFTPLSSVIKNDASATLPGQPRWLADFRGQLIGCFQAQTYAYSEPDQAWQGTLGSAMPLPAIAYQTLSKRPVFNLNTAANAPDSACAGSFTAYVMRSSVAGTQTAYLSVQDTAGVATVQPAVALITNSFRIKVVSDGSRFWVLSMPATFLSTTIQVFSASGVQLATSTVAWGAARDNWDVRFAPALSQVVLATPLGATTDMRYMTYAAGSITLVTHTTPAADCTKGVAFLDNSAGTNVYISGADNTFGVRAFEITSAGALALTFTVDAANVDYVGNITGYAEFGGSTPAYVVVAYSVLQDNTLGGYQALNNFTKVYMTTRASASSLLATQRSVCLASRAYRDSTGNYFAVMYYQSEAFSGTFGGYDLGSGTEQPSYFVLRLATVYPHICGQFDYGFAAMQNTSRVSVDYNPWHLSSVTSDVNNVQHCALGFVGENFPQSGVSSSYTGIADYMFAPKAGRPIETTDELLIPGCGSMRFDGNVVVEDGIHLAPEYISSSPGAGGGLQVAERYIYCGVYEWLDNAGNIVQSIPSVPARLGSLGAGNMTWTTVWTSLRTTTKTNVRLSIYRTFSPTAGGSTTGIELRKVGEVLNSTAADTLTFVDSYSDSTVARNQAMYTQPLNINAPQPLEYYPAPACSKGITFDGRTFVIGYDNAIWFSEQRVEGFGAPFNPFLRIIMPTTATVLAIVPMDARLLILCADGTAWTVPSGGLPNNNLTTGSIPQPEQLPFTVGSTGAALMLPIGAIFASAHSAWLMDRGLSAQFIGSNVVDEIASDKEVIDICVDDEQRVYLTLGFFGELGTYARILVYDLIVGAWYTWDSPSAPSVACSWKGRYVYADATSVQVLDPDEDTDWTDNGTAIVTTAELSSMSFGGPDGFMRLWGGEFFGQYRGPHLIKVSFTFDNNAAPSQVFTQPVGVDPERYRWDVRQEQQKMIAVGVTFEDSFSWPTISTIASHTP